MTRITKVQQSVDADGIISKMAEAKAQLDAWQAVYDHAKEQLTAAHRDGLVPTKFQRDGYSFVLTEGRQTWEYPASLKAEIKLLQTTAQESGTATRKQGEPYWTLRPGKG